MIEKQATRQKILELCSEDDYGIWELFGSVVPVCKDKGQQENFETLFLKLVEDLVKEHKIVSKKENPKTNKLESVDFNPDILALQLKKIATPDPKSFYWFGVS
jgi:hypothetical protein